MGPATVSSLGPLNVVDCFVPNNRKQQKNIDIKSCEQYIYNKKAGLTYNNNNP